MNRVAIQKCSNYEEDSVRAAVRDVIENSAFPHCQGKTILIKPNILSDSRPEAGITTHPSVVRAVVEECFSRGAKEIFIGDSPGLHSPTFHAKVCGIADVCSETGAKWVDFAKETRVHHLDGKTQVALPTILDRVDFTISLSKFKTHQLMYTTGAVKNLFGIMPGLSKSPMHLKFPSREAFASFIVKLFLSCKVEYALMDAVIGMEGPGPANGTLRYVGLIMGSANAFLLDEAQAMIMGYEPGLIPILAEGKRKKTMPEAAEYSILKPQELVIHDFRKINIEKAKGLFSSLILPFFTRGRDRKRTRQRPQPAFENEKCIHCLRCLQICPPKALTHSDRIIIDGDKCIRCYCCAEMCPADAIVVKE